MCINRQLGTLVNPHGGWVHSEATRWLWHAAACTQVIHRPKVLRRFVLLLILPSQSNAFQRKKHLPGGYPGSHPAYTRPILYNGFSVITPPNRNGFGWNLGPQCTLGYKNLGEIAPGVPQNSIKTYSVFFCRQYNAAFWTHPAPSSTMFDTTDTNNVPEHIPMRNFRISE